jgi:hypothetical protein
MRNIVSTIPVLDTMSHHLMKRKAMDQLGAGCLLERDESGQKRRSGAARKASS